MWPIRLSPGDARRQLPVPENGSRHVWMRLAEMVLEYDRRSHHGSFGFFQILERIGDLSLDVPSVGNHWVSTTKFLLQDFQRYRDGPLRAKQCSKSREALERNLARQVHVRRDRSPCASIVRARTLAWSRIAASHSPATSQQPRHVCFHVDNGRVIWRQFVGERAVGQ